MVQITIGYSGELHCTASHGPSGNQLETDAPVDHQGRGESFSPTDLLATALGTCMLTIMGIVADKHGWSITGSEATVTKHMVTSPLRRVGKLEVAMRVEGGHDEVQQAALVKAAMGCPVARSISQEVEVELDIIWC
jgi:putative redox protein